MNFDDFFFALFNGKIQLFLSMLFLVTYENTIRRIYYMQSTEYSVMQRSEAVEKFDELIFLL